MNTSCFVCVLLMTGCVEKYWQDDVPVKSMTMDSNRFAASAWEDRVRRDVLQWRTSLPEGCPMPFHFDQDDPDASCVWLVPAADWHITGAIGVFKTGNFWELESPNSTISILALPNGTLEDYDYDPTWTVLMHELGHAIGLRHADPAYGPSLMLPAAGQLETRDIEAAAHALGCGPPGPDPYDQH